MEAPDKLYLHPNYKGEVSSMWLTVQITNEDIEYTRTDAFIEKACEWLNHKSCLYIQYSEGGTSFNNEQFMEDFKKAMKL